MSDINCNRNPLMRDGTSQQQRLLQALLPSYVSVDERSMDDLIGFAQKFANEIQFFGPDNAADGNWADFFDKEISTQQKTDPHFALFIAFLEIFKIAQDDLNTITERHLNFYYRDVLKMEEEAAVPDQVHIIFELAKSVGTHLIKAGTLLKAGKDATGVDLVYKVNEDLVVNKAQVAELKAVFTNNKIDTANPANNHDNRIYASPVANSADGLGAEIELDEPKWRTFGRITNPELDRTAIGAPKADRPQGDVGFALASPNLLLAEGDRTVTITLDLLNAIDPALDLNNAFKLMFSGEEEYILAEGSATAQVQANGTRITIVREITKDQPAVVPYNKEVLGDLFDTKWPLVKILLKKEFNQNPFIYKPLKKANLRKATIKVDVVGVRTLTLQNDFSQIDPSKPFLPWGSRPVLGADFIIGSTEIFQKKLTSFDIDITWHGLPTDATLFPDGFKSYYTKYLPTSENAKRRNHLFKACVSLLDKKEWIDLNHTNTADCRYRIFEPNASPITAATGVGVAPRLPDSGSSGTTSGGGVATSTASRVPIDVFAFAVNVVNDEPLEEFRRISISNPTLQGVSRDPEMEVADRLDTESQKGYIRMQLTDIDFGHKNFQESYTTELLKNTGGSEPPTTVGDLPNEPYTPTIKELTLNYSSTVEVPLNFATGTDLEVTYNNRVDQFFHVQPFGVAEQHPFILRGSNVVSMLPQFNDEGALYIGISNLVPSQTLALLFKVAEGSSNPDLPQQPVTWSYMVNNQWVEFTDLKILKETTNGLLTTGIVRFDVPKEASSTNTVLTPGLHWLRASVTKGSAAVSDMIDIRAQVITATFEDRNNDPNHLREDLPAETISKLRVSDPAVKKVLQPFASFNGKIREQSTEFFIRVSERLRHKNRAITIWDHERLVLEKFPSVYKVKCINHTRYTGSLTNYSELAPGHVTLIVISNVRNQNNVDPLKPKTSLITLTEISEYIKTIGNPCVNLHVKNPLYEEIRVRFDVKFRVGFDNGFYGQKLNEDIKAFLSPWAFEGGKDIVFGGRVHKSMILNFVEEQEYVDFVTCFEMDQIIIDPINPLAIQIKANIDEAIATTSASILVSDDLHEVRVLEEFAQCGNCGNIIQGSDQLSADECRCDVPQVIFVGPNGTAVSGDACQVGIGSTTVENTFIVGVGANVESEGIGCWIIEDDFEVQ